MSNPLTKNNSFMTFLANTVGSIVPQMYQKSFYCLQKWMRLAYLKCKYSELGIPCDNKLASVVF